MSQDHNHLNRATWESKYHVVFTPKHRKKVLFGQIRRHLGTVFHEACLYERGDDPCLYQEPGDGRQAAGSVAVEAVTS